MRIAAVLFVLLVVGNPVAAQPLREKPAELDALSQYVGDWTSDVTSRPAVWAPNAVQYRTSNHAEFVMDGWFLQHIEVSHEAFEPGKVGKALFVWTYDANLKKYVGWAFYSSGAISHVTGTWNAPSKSFTSSETELPPGTTMKLTEAFPDNGTINGSLLFTGNDGRTMFDMAWTRTRQEVVAGSPLQEQWARIGKPIQPVPDEVQKLNVFLGEWNSEFIHRPSIVSPRGGTTKATMTGKWILDGRFLLGRSDLGNFQSFWVSGYDTNRKAFRYIRFQSNGQIEENIGQWNEAGQVFDWKVANAPPGLTRTSTTRRLDDGTVESDIVVKNQSGQTHMDLTIRSTLRR